jgi:RND superfamily putative drug exporter
VLERWTRLVLRLRYVVVALWLIVFVAGAWAYPRLPDLLSNSLDVPDSDSQRAQAILTRGFGERTDGAFTVVFRVGGSPDRAVRAELEGVLAESARSVPRARVGQLFTGPGVVYGDVTTALPLHEAKQHTEALRAALRRSGAPSRTYVSGQPAIQHDLDPVFESDLRRGEALALPVALVVLLAVFGLSFAVFIPFLFAACTISGTLFVLYVVAHGVSVVTYATNLVVLIGLGLAIDYSLLIVHRFREELDRGHESQTAVVRTMATAGRTVVFSGLVVALGLALLLVMPVPFIRSIGIGGVLIPLASVAAALSLQPALLSIFGDRGTKRAPVAAFLRRHAGRGAPRQATTGNYENGFWAGFARTILRRPTLFLAVGTAVLVAAALPVLFIELTPGSISGAPASLESIRGFEVLRERVGVGAVTPTTIAIDTGSPGLARVAPTRPAIDRLADDLFRDPEVFVVASGRRTPYTEREGRYSRVLVMGRSEYGDEPTQSFVRRLREQLIPAAGFPDAVAVHVGGAPAQGADFLDRAYDAFPWLVAVMLVLTYGVLLRAFRSLLVPLKAVALNLLSVAAACGLMVVIFQWGLGAGTLGLYERGQVEAWIPIFLFATLFGLSMDYEVFLVTRMRESWDRAHDNEVAIAYGLERTGRIITAAAVIMVAAFLGFAAGQIAPLQEFGVGLALAVLIDATIVRAILVPSFMAVVGRLNWWLPARVARVVRVAPSPLVEAAGSDAGAAGTVRLRD